MAKKIESPDFAKMSQATAISLGLVSGRMYRGAFNSCVNLLVHYPEGCSANCAYCGLAKKRPGIYYDKSFIHVAWPVFSMDEIIESINRAPSYVKRICISMITNYKCRVGTIAMTQRLKHETSLPISILISPTILDNEDLIELKESGADKIGVALDLSTQELFDKYRGREVSGPHKWDKYWETLKAGLEIFGHPNVGAHLMVGMGETEEQITFLMDELWMMGVVNHLFSFFAEEKSKLSNRPQPPWSTYLRVQLARYLIEEGLSNYENIGFDDEGRIIDFGLAYEKIDKIINSGMPFMTTGCTGPDGEVACNRPFGNCLPDVKQWNYPYPPNEEELVSIHKEIFQYYPWEGVPKNILTMKLKGYKN